MSRVLSKISNEKGFKTGRIIFLVISYFSLFCDEKKNYLLPVNLFAAFELKDQIKKNNFINFVKKSY